MVIDKGMDILLTDEEIQDAVFDLDIDPEGDKRSVAKAQLKKVVEWLEENTDECDDYANVKCLPIKALQALKEIIKEDEDGQKEKGGVLNLS